MMSNKSQEPRTTDAVLAVIHGCVAVFWSVGTWVQWGRGEHLLASAYIVMVISFVLISAFCAYRYIRDSRRQKAESLTPPQNDPNDESLDTEQP